jgi:Xaa-Pro dipeptidase
MNTARVEEMLALAEEEGLEAVALMPGPNLFYLTGLSFHLSERPTVALFPVDQPPALVLPAFEAGKAGDLRTFVYTDEEGYVLAFHEACASLELAGVRLGVETLRMRLLEARILERYAPNSCLVPADELMARVRMRKDPAEVSAMREAVTVAQDAFLTWLGGLRVGMTEKEAAARLVAALLAHGAEGLAFDPIVATGPHGASPHAVPGERAFQRGDWVVVDWGAMVDGYASDITRAVVFGGVEGYLAEIHDVVSRANEAGRASVTPDARAEDVDTAARVVIERAGYGPQFTHRTGHGLGLEPHEPPYIVAGNERALEPGMTFTVEPGIYLEGVGGVRIEDDVLVTDNGMETLTTLSREPFVVSA